MAKKSSSNLAQYTSLKPKFKRFHKFIVNKAPSFCFKTTSNGNFALRSVENGRISASEIEACKKYIKKTIKKKGKLLSRVYTYLPLTKKPGETRMGKGKSSRVSSWVCPVAVGNIIFEISGLSPGSSVQLLKRVQQKISIDTKVSGLIR